MERRQRVCWRDTQFIRVVVSGTFSTNLFPTYERRWLLSCPCWRSWCHSVPGTVHRAEGHSNSCFTSFPLHDLTVRRRCQTKIPTFPLVSPLLFCGLKQTHTAVGLWMPHFSLDAPSSSLDSLIKTKSSWEGESYFPESRSCLSLMRMSASTCYVLFQLWEKRGKDTEIKVYYYVYLIVVVLCRF
jgi:hypothetical protein